MSRKSKEQKTVPDIKPSIGRLTVLIIGIYYTVLVGFILCLIAADAQAVIRTADVLQYSQDWMMLVYGAYYVLPFVCGIGFGLTFRPFWANFRNVTVVIFLGHLLYSGIFYVLRLNAEAQWQKEIFQSQMGRLAVRNFRSQFVDDPLDGFIDNIRVEMDTDTAKLDQGDYALTVSLSQNGQVLPEGVVDVYRFTVKKDGSSVAKLKFDIVAGPLNKHFKNGAVDVDLTLQKLVKVPAHVAPILFWARWAPFLKTVSWEGHDLVFNDRVLELQQIRKVGSFYLIPIVAEPGK